MSFGINIANTFLLYKTEKKKANEGEGLGIGERVCRIAK